MPMPLREGVRLAVLSKEVGAMGTLTRKTQAPEKSYEKPSVQLDSISTMSSSLLVMLSTTETVECLKNTRNHLGRRVSIVIATGMETRPGFCAGYGRVRVRVQIIVPGATRTRIYLDPYPSTRVEYWLTKKKNYTST